MRSNRRVVLGTKTAEQVRLNPSIATPASTLELTGLLLERRLRMKRSERYTEALTRLDAGGAVCSKEQVDAYIHAIQQEFPELKPYQFPLGIIAKCYLGSPYEVHVLSPSLHIIEHYRVGQALPSGLEKGRTLALHPGYCYIEVFSDSICAVAKNGDVSMIKG